MPEPAPPFFAARRAAHPEQVRAGEVALIGVPFDALSTERSGSAEGPAALRRASRQVGHYRVHGGQTVDWADRLVDLGDVEANRFEPYSAFEPVRCMAEGVHRAGGRPLLVGGDHSLTYAAVTAAAAAHPGLRLVQIDAHHDATDPAQWGCRYNHGTFVRNLIEDGALAGPDVVQVGVRDFQWRDSGARFLQSHGAQVIPMHVVDRAGLAPFFEVLSEGADRPMHVTLDIDSVDPAFAPGTGEHMVGGFTSREILALVRELFDGSRRIVSADLVEVAPPLDPTGRTCALAAQLLALMVDGLRGE